MKNSPEQTHDFQKWQSRAPGWRVRCLKCGLTEHWGKYGIRRAAFGRKFIPGYCSRCRWLRIHVVEKGEVPQNP